MSGDGPVGRGSLDPTDAAFVEVVSDLLRRGHSVRFRAKGRQHAPHHPGGRGDHGRAGATGRDPTRGRDPLPTPDGASSRTGWRVWFGTRPARLGFIPRVTLR